MHKVFVVLKRIELNSNLTYFIVLIHLSFVAFVVSVSTLKKDALLEMNAASKNNRPFRRISPVRSKHKLETIYKIFLEAMCATKEKDKNILGTQNKSQSAERNEELASTRYVLLKV